MWDVGRKPPGMMVIDNCLPRANFYLSQPKTVPHSFPNCNLIVSVPVPIDKQQSFPLCSNFPIAVSISFPIPQSTFALLVCIMLCANAEAETNLRSTKQIIHTEKTRITQKKEKHERFYVVRCIAYIKGTKRENSLLPKLR